MYVLFPELTNGGPIYGFDIIAGKNKVTGAFHDFSPLLQKQHPLTEWFKNKINGLNLVKRESYQIGQKQFLVVE